MCSQQQMNKNDLVCCGKNKVKQFLQLFIIHCPLQKQIRCMLYMSSYLLQNLMESLNTSRGLHRARVQRLGCSCYLISFIDLPDCALGFVVLRQSFIEITFADNIIFQKIGLKPVMKRVFPDSYRQKGNFRIQTIFYLRTFGGGAIYFYLPTSPMKVSIRYLSKGFRES